MAPTTRRDCSASYDHRFSVYITRLRSAHFVTGKPKYVTFAHAHRSMAEGKMKWNFIPLVSREMNLDLTLSSGQAFRWVRSEGEEGEEWSGAIGDR